MRNIKVISILFMFLSMVVSLNSLAQDDKKLGTAKAGLVNLKGAIYLLQDADEVSYESINGIEPIGFIYTQALDYPVRSFEEGFPGITERYEWFGIVYTGIFEIDKIGEYKWKLLSDDGSRLWIDDKEIINNDGIHAENSEEGSVILDKGLHKIKVWFFQGPAMELGIQLFVTPPGGEEKIFNLNDFSASLISSLKKKLTQKLQMRV